MKWMKMTRIISIIYDELENGSVNLTKTTNGYVTPTYMEKKKTVTIVFVFNKQCIISYIYLQTG